MDISKHIEKRGLSRAQICEEAQISRAYLSLIETGQRQVGPNKVQALAAALKLRVKDLRPDLAILLNNTIERSR